MIEYNFIVIESKDSAKIVEYCKTIGVIEHISNDEFEQEDYLALCFKDYDEQGSTCKAGIIYTATDLFDVDLVMTLEELQSGKYDYLFDAGKLNLI